MELSDLQERVVCAFLAIWGELVEEHVPEDVATMAALAHVWSCAEPGDIEAFLQHPEADLTLDQMNRFATLVIHLAHQMEDRLEEAAPATPAEA